jgi:hypothetical protein
MSRFQIHQPLKQFIAYQNKNHTFNGHGRESPGKSVFATLPYPISWLIFNKILIFSMEAKQHIVHKNGIISVCFGKHCLT